MSHLVLDRSSCRRDGACTRVCPSGLIRTGTDGYPESVPGAETRCIRCGHCLAVCSSGALALEHARADQLPLLAADWRLGPERVGQFLSGRRSIRSYREEPLERSTIAAMIGMAQYAPSGHNTQPISWTVVEKRSDVRRIAEVTAAWMRRVLVERPALAQGSGMPPVIEAWDSGIDRICRDAPHLIVAHAPSTLGGAGPLFGAIAINYLELAAVSLGVGTCCAGFVAMAAGDSKDARELLGIPDGQSCCGVAMAGHPAIAYRRVPPRNEPRIQWA